MNNTIPAVDKTIQLLEMLSGGAYSQSELSRTLEISMSSCYRILQTLLAHNWVEKNDSGVYTLSTGVLPLLKFFDRDLELLKKARAKVDEICLKHHIACKLSLRRGNEQVTDHRAEPAGPVALTGHSGSTFPLIEGSVGAALLGDDSDEQIAEAVRNCHAPIPEKEDPGLLAAAIDEVRRKGCVLNLRKNRWNIAAFSIPLRDTSGKIFAALTLIGNACDFEGGQREKWEQILKKAASECGTIQF